MIDPTLRQKVEQAARLAAQRARQVDVDAWLERLKAAAISPGLAERVSIAQGHRWAGAIPTWEPVDLAKQSGGEAVEAVGIDDSQIYPLDRSPVLWAYIQAVAYRMQRPPLFESQFVDIGTEIAQGGSQALDLLENRDELVTLTNAWRTLLEMRMACAAAQVYPGELVLLDNGLLPWLSVGGQSAHRRLNEYLDLLLALRRGLVAGVISGPQSRLLARLVNLAEAETVEQGIQGGHDIADIILMRRLLQPGERSALFLHGSPRNKIFQDHNAGVYFFFLCVNEQEIARVEIPAWLAEDPRLVDSIHASVLADARLTGYSYVLSQAHLHVTIPLDLGNTLHAKASACYWAEAGHLYFSSSKNHMKGAPGRADRLPTP
jgi:hypothetical protein